MITIKTYKNNEGYVLIMGDDGKGMDSEVDLKSAESLGFQLINTLIKQIKGDIEVKTDDGTIFTIKFNEVEYKKRI